MNGDAQPEPSAETKTARDMLRQVGAVAVHETHPCASTPAISSTALEYLKEEQKQRRAEIEALINRFGEDQRYGLAITGGVWSWFATNTDKIKPPILYVTIFLPALLTAFFIWRRSTISGSITRCAAYIRELEDAFGVPERLGWERWLSKNPHSARLGRASSAFWYALLFVNLLLALLFAKLSPW